MEKLMVLRDILNNIEQFEWSDDLFLPEDETWSLDTKGAVLPDDIDDMENDSDEIPKFAKEHNLKYVLGIDSVRGIISNISDQKASCTDNDLFEAFLYYYDNDAFLVIE
ncbi:hypothetical protein SAMN04487970_102646 [Paenibacillus tianmuensis]|uniref:DUF7716 domain-containing protein n=1 Tax=Paenibacillus tianmuensis TaxID=624147 RepID=A0A1G4SBV0_9BACL|nr:hypothetical protein [Paenibacillus tianmuensis]SCW66692.1 hypothetical protein SAMN04487970_102646 [Paenibacillus tianmuensis]